jgi:broad specificity phosphatase PhoE
MTDRVWLVRHASTEWSGERWCGRTDLSLSAAGVAEARSLASRLAAELPAEVALVTSPARRARETAEPIALTLGLRVDIDGAIDVDLDHGLQEVDFGRAEGCTWADIERRLPGLAAALAAGASEVDWPDGETAEAVRRRVGAAWQRLAERDRPVVAVCHGGVIRAVLAGLGLGLGPEQRWSVAPASTLELRRTGRVWAVVPADEPAQVRLR